MIRNVKIFVRETLCLSKYGIILKDISLNLYFAALYEGNNDGSI